MTETVAKPPSDNDTPVGFKIPGPWLERADKLASALSRSGPSVTRTAVLRAALARGLDVLEEETPRPRKRSS